MDFLGLRTLTVIDDTLAALRERGIHIDIDEIPLDDAETFALFAEKNTVGIFQFESSGMKENLAKLQPQRLDFAQEIIARRRVRWRIPHGTRLDAKERQVKKAEIGFTCNFGGFGNNVVCLTFMRED